MTVFPPIIILLFSFPASGSLSGIIDHWGAWGRVLQPWAGPGHWHDMDTILAGNGCITHDEERTQVAIWAISASPFIMGNVSGHIHMFGALCHISTTQRRLGPVHPQPPIPLARPHPLLAHSLAHLRSRPPCPPALAAAWRFTTASL